MANIRLLAYLKQKPMFEVDDWQTNIYLSPSYALDFVCEKKREKKKVSNDWLTLPVKCVFPFQVDQECSDFWRGGGGAALKSIKHVSGKSD